MVENSLEHTNLAMPRKSHKLLIQQLNHQHCLSVLTRAMMDELSSTYAFHMWKMATTLAATAQLKQALAGKYITSEEEALYQGPSQEYLEAIHKFGR